MNMSPTERLLARTEGAIGWLIFSNPARHNAMTVDMWEAIPKILDHFESDPAIHVIVLKGEGGKAFVSGADISQFDEQRASAQEVRRYDAMVDESQDRLKTSAKPVIAMIEGYCIGGGLGIALSCDLRIAGESARFAIPAARLGVGYQWRGVKSLVDLVGPAFAKEIFFTGRQFTAAEAEKMGLVNRVLPDAELARYVASYCASIAENAPLTIAAQKGIIAELTRPSGEVDTARCDALVARCFASADYVEGRRAFMEKRKPVFRGE